MHPVNYKLREELLRNEEEPSDLKVIAGAVVMASGIWLILNLVMGLF